MSSKTEWLDECVVEWLDCWIDGCLSIPAYLIVMLDGLQINCPSAFHFSQNRILDLVKNPH